MKLIIDMPKHVYDATKAMGKVIDADNEIAAEAIANGTPIPNNATNGDVIMAMFPNLEIEYTDTDEYTNKPRYVKLIIGNTIITRMSADRWNSPYQEGVRNDS